MTFERRGRREVAVDNVSFELAPSATLSIIGPSGAGKSTLGRLMVGLIEPDRGHVSFAGHVLAALSAGRRRRLRRQMQLLFQDSTGALDPRLTARTLIEAPFRIHGEWRAGVVEPLADLVQLPLDRLTRRPPHLSGGERQRVALARALALRPRLLVLDEPLTGLDALTASALRNRILELQRQLLTTMVWITHDLAEAAQVAETIAVMAAGQLVEIGPAKHVMAKPEHEVTKALLQAGLTPGLSTDSG